MGSAATLSAGDGDRCCVPQPHLLLSIRFVAIHHRSPLRVEFKIASLRSVTLRAQRWHRVFSASDFRAMLGSLNGGICLDQRHRPHSRRCVYNLHGSCHAAALEHLSDAPLLRQTQAVSEASTSDGGRGQSAASSIERVPREDEASSESLAYAGLHGSPVHAPQADSSPRSARTGYGARPAPACRLRPGGGLAGGSDVSLGVAKDRWGAGA